MVSSFADRLWWSRHKAGLGATRLARIVKCSQSLISSLERNNAEKSKLNNQFAKALNVDPTWLAFGNPDRAPAGFDEATAREGRERMGSEPPQVVRMPAPAEPRWAAPENGSPLGEPLAPLSDADALWTRIMHLFIDYANVAGPELAAQSIEALRRYIAVLAEKPGRDQQIVSASDQRNDGAKH